MKHILNIALLSILLVGNVALAQEPMTEGEVRTVNKDAGKITLRHGEIKNLDMGTMTMVFKVKEAAMLEQVKAGDKVGFRAEKIGGE